MDKKTLIALNKSIVKYIDIASGRKEPTTNSGDCCLCLIYYENYSEHDCEGCPINSSGFYRCTGSVFDEYREAVFCYEPYDGYAAQEAEFLIQLLPVEHADQWRN